MDNMVFGFGQFITALALLIVLFTISDARFKFRIAIARKHFRGATYFVIAFIGIASLLTSLWVKQSWPFIHIPHITSSDWQAFLGFIFFATVLSWIYFGLVNPPIFSEKTAKRYFEEIRSALIRGQRSEISVLADELSSSAGAIVNNAPTLTEMKRIHLKGNKSKKNKTAKYAHNLLLLIASPTMCKYVVEACPGTAAQFAEKVSETSRYDIAIGEFFKNITEAAIGYKNSPLYLESDVFGKDYIGQAKAWSKAIYGDPVLIESLGRTFRSPLDVDFRGRSKWDVDKWRVYAFALYTAVVGFLKNNDRRPMPFALIRPFHNIKESVFDLGDLDGETGVLSHKDQYNRLKVVVDLIEDLIRLLDSRGLVAPGTWRANPKMVPWGEKTIYDCIAELMQEIVLAATYVKQPIETSHLVRYVCVWGRFFGLGAKSKSWMIVQGKLQRLLLDQVRQFGVMANYQNAAVVGFLLNVMWSEITGNSTSYGRAYRGLAKAVVKVMKNKYEALWGEDKVLASYVLSGGLEYDAEENKILMRYLNNKTGPITGTTLHL